MLDAMKKIFSFVIVLAAVAMVSACAEKCDSTACANCEKCDSTKTCCAEKAAEAEAAK